MAALDSIEVRLLGRPAFAANDEWTELPPGKSTAILLFLAFRGGWVGREEVVHLFWPESPEAQARSNLRPLLSRVRDEPYARGLERERSRIRWPVATDLWRFREEVAEQRWVRAWRHVGGELLDGFTIANAPEFERWLEAERAELRVIVRTVGTRAAHALAARGEHVAHLEVLGALLKDDPFDEEVARAHILALARDGARSEALAAYERLRLGLDEELGVQPEDATRELAARIERRAHVERSPRARADVPVGAGEVEGLPRPARTRPRAPHSGRRGRGARRARSRRWPRRPRR
jgi:DNA-binding SARP family transcriptional activator